MRHRKARGYSRARGLLLVAITSVLLAACGAAETGPTPVAQSEDWRADWGVAEGYSISIDAEGFSLPTAIAFVPSPGPDPKDPLYFVTELYGTVKVVTNDRTVLTFAEDFYPRETERSFVDPGDEYGLASICLQPEYGYVYVTFTYFGAGGELLYNGLVRFESEPETFSTSYDALTDLSGLFAEFPTGPSHQIGSCQAVGESLYVGVGDGVNAELSQVVETPYGKVLRMSLDGEPLADNPLFAAESAAGLENYVWAYGFRNPFGLVVVDERVFVADNGIAIDRFLEIQPGGNYLWDGNDWSIGARSAAVIAPAVGPAQTGFLGAGTGVNFPRYSNTFFVAASGKLAAGILNVAYDFDAGRLAVPPSYFLRFRGTGDQLIAGQAFGPDGLYFAPMLPTQGDSTAVYRIAYDPGQAHPYRPEDVRNAEQLLSDYQCRACHSLNEVGGNVGPPLDRAGLVERLTQRLNSEGYLASLDQVDGIQSAPMSETAEFRQALREAEGMERVRQWLVYRILEPRFDNPNAQMPNLGLSLGQAEVLADYLLAEEESAVEGAGDSLFAIGGDLGLVHLLLAFALGALGPSAIAHARRRLRAASELAGKEEKPALSMAEMPQLPVLLSSALAISLLLVATSLYGPGVSGSGVEYIAAAENLAAGRGLLDVAGRPFTSSGPLLPAIMAGLARLTGLDALQAAELINALSLPLILWMAWKLIQGVGLLSRFWEYTLLLGIALSVSLLSIAGNVSVEPLFIVLVLGFLLLGKRYVDNPSRANLAWMAAPAALAPLLSWAGLSLVFTGFIFLLVQHRGEWWVGVRRGLAFAALGSTPLLIWDLVWIAPQLGAPLQPLQRQWAAADPLGNLGPIYARISGWFLPSTLTKRVDLAIWLLGLGALLAFWNSRERIGAWWLGLFQDGNRLLVLFILVYMTFTLFTLTGVGQASQQDDHFLLPVLIPLLILFFYSLDRLLLPHLQRRGRYWRLALYAGLALWLAYYGFLSARFIGNSLEEGVAAYNVYNTGEYRRSGFIQYLQEEDLEAGVPIYSNDADAMYFFIRRPVRNSPSDDANFNAQDESVRRQMESWPPEGRAYLIWLLPNWKDNYFSPEQLRAVSDLNLLFDNSDGKLYIARATSPDAGE